MKKFTPVKKTKNAYIFQLVSILAFILLIALSSILKSYRFLYQIGAIITATVFIQVTSRYLMSVYSYILDGNGFVVVRQQGKRATQLCNVELSTGKAIMKKSAYKALPASERRKYSICYNYSQNLFPVETYYFLFEFNGKQGIIIAELSDEFALLIEEAMKNCASRNFDSYEQ